MHDDANCPYLAANAALRAALALLADPAHYQGDAGAVRVKVTQIAQGALKVASEAAAPGAAGE